MGYNVHVIYKTQNPEAAGYGGFLKGELHSPNENAPALTHLLQHVLIRPLPEGGPF